MALAELLVVRATRLLPLVFLGTLAAALIETQRPGVADEWLHAREIVTAFFMGSLLLPVWWTTTLEMLLFPLNLPVWSLFFEAVANCVAAVITTRRMAVSIAVGIFVLSAAVLVWAGLSVGSLSVGYTETTFGFGFARVFFSFFLGAFLYLGGATLPRIPAAISLVALIGVLAIPSAIGVTNGLFDLAAVFIVFPLVIVHMSRLTPPPGLIGLCRLSGELSYPIYAIHYPIVRALALIIRGLGVGMWAQFALTLAATIFIVAVSALVYKYYDLPVRSFLNRRRTSFLAKKPQNVV